VPQIIPFPHGRLSLSCGEMKGMAEEEEEAEDRDTESK